MKNEECVDSYHKNFEMKIIKRKKQTCPFHCQNTPKLSYGDASTEISS